MSPRQPCLVSWALLLEVRLGSSCRVYVTLPNNASTRNSLQKLMATRIEIADSIFSCIDELRHPTYPTGPTARNSTDARTVATGFQGYGLSILEQCEEFRHDWRHVCRDRVCD